MSNLTCMHLLCLVFQEIFIDFSPKSLLLQFNSYFIISYFIIQSYDCLYFRVYTSRLPEQFQVYIIFFILDKNVIVLFVVCFYHLVYYEHIFSKPGNSSFDIIFDKYIVFHLIDALYLTNLPSVVLVYFCITRNTV